MRKLYECNPFAFLIEQAGGKATDNCGNRILELEVLTIDEACEIVLGNPQYVDEAIEFFKSDEFTKKR